MLDRYGIACGARVREDARDRWLSRHEYVDWWVGVNDTTIHDMPEKPQFREFYSDWFLLDADRDPRPGARTSGGRPP
ncbi:MULTISPECIES: hypothetical protein [Halolamina]|uniref:hypothetical protein n=1 Tax=Halolamina TaxID=1075397 RepID=UPI0011607680|nr:MULTISPECIES: hypothetical protein [Halolamina]NHX36327.1 hypothetical protein [Halolamina sp. R1-12]